MYISAVWIFGILALAVSPAHAQTPESTVFKKDFVMTLTADLNLIETSKDSETYKQYYSGGEEKSDGFLGVFANSHCELICEKKDCADRLNVVASSIKDGDRVYTNYLTSDKKVSKLQLVSGSALKVTADATIDGNEVTFKAMDQKYGAELTFKCGRATGTGLWRAKIEPKNVAYALGEAFGFSVEVKKAVMNKCFGKKNRHFRHFTEFKFDPGTQTVTAVRANGEANHYPNQKSLQDFYRNYHVCEPVGQF